MTIPGGVTSIGERAFDHCTGLKSVTIQKGATAIGEGMFAACPSLESVTIPEGVTSIGERAFFACTHLESVTLPASVTGIGDQAFDGCGTLCVIYYPGTKDAWDALVAAGKDVLPEELRGTKGAFIHAAPNDATLGGVAGGGLYKVGFNATLTATPADGCAFINWTENGGEVSADATYSVGVDNIDRDLTANFAYPEWAALQAAITAAGATPTTITVSDYAGTDKTITALSTDTALTIASGHNITLDLDGCTLDRNLSEAKVNGNVITVEGTLTVKDGRANKTGRITGGNTKGDGGGVIVNGGKFTLEGGSITGGNNVGDGGGIIVDGGALVLLGGSITGNAANCGGGVIVRDGTFELAGGAICGNAAAVSGGGAFVAEGGLMTMTGGAIGGDGDGEGNVAGDDVGGGVCVDTDGRFEMRNGTISGNRAGSGGGGLYVYEYGSAEMSGGAIRGNASDFQGGGAYIDGDGAFAVSGSAEITGNTAARAGGGVFAYDDAAFSVSGKPVIHGNTLSDGVTVDNVWLSGYYDDDDQWVSTPIRIVGALENATPIGVTMAEPGAFTAGLEGNGDASGFASDNTAYAVVLTDDGEAKLALIFNVTIADGIRNGTVAADRAKATEGETVTLTVTPETGYAPDAVKVNGTEIQPANGVYSFAMPAADATVTATFELMEAKASAITKQPGDVALTYGYESGSSLSVSADAAEGHTLAYQWYINTANSNRGGVKIDGANQATFSIPAGLDAGEYFYYCVVTATRVSSGMTSDAESNVAKVAVKPQGVTMTANSRNTDVYDGTEKAVTGYTCSVNGLTFSDVTASGKGTNAGEYDVVFTGVTLNTTRDTTGNYVVTATVPGKLTIKPAGVTLTANSRDTDVYDGAEKAVTGYTCSVAGLTFNGVSASGKGANAGEYDVTFSGVTVNETKDATGNYVVTGTTNGKLTIKPAGVTLTANSRDTDVYDGSLTVDPASATVTIIGASDVATYDGKAHSVGGYTVQIDDPLYAETDFTFSGEAAAARTDAGMTNMGLAEKQFANANPNFEGVTFNVTDGYQRIEPAAITIAADDKASKYGKKTRDLTYQVGGAYVDGDELGVPLSTEATAASDVGAYPITVAWNGNPNYTAKLTDGTYTIAKGELNADASGYSGVYDGAAHGIAVNVDGEGAKVYYGAGELTADNCASAGSTTPPTYTDAGTYTVYYWIEDANREGLGGSRTVEILKATGHKEGLTDAQKPTGKALTFNDAAQPLVDAPAGLPEGYAKVQYSLDGGATWSDAIPTATNAGDYTVQVKYVGDKNHNDMAGDPIAVTVAKADGDRDTLTDDQKPTGGDLAFYGAELDIVTAPEELPKGYAKVQYSIDGGATWSDEIPSVAEPGYFTVDVKYVGDRNHNDFTGDPIAVKVTSGDTAKLLIAEMRSTGDTSLQLSWKAILGADGYDVYIASCGSEDYALAGSVEMYEEMSWTFSGLKKHHCYKAYVQAWAMQSGEKVDLQKVSPIAHCYTGGGAGKYVNPARVTVRKSGVVVKLGKTSRISPKVKGVKHGKVFAHNRKWRYYSTDPGVATVDEKGVVTAVGKGKATITVTTDNGKVAKIKINVR